MEDWLPGSSMHYKISKRRGNITKDLASSSGKRVSAFSVECRIVVSC